MADHPTRIRAALAAGPLSAGELRARLDVSRPTLARALATLPDEIVTWGAARATQYALRDRLRDLPDMPVYRVSKRGRITLLGQLIPVRPEGFVMAQTDGITRHHEGLPWWLSDMRPQGFLGRAFARQQALYLLESCACASTSAAPRWPEHWPPCPMKSLHGALRARPNMPCATACETCRTCRCTA